jgi:hypothetical protein
VDSGANATTAPAGAANPQESRTCSKCEATKVISPESWPYRKGREGRYAAYGTICMGCEKVRKAKYEERRHGLAALVNEVSVPEEGTPEQKRKAIVKANKLDVAQALKTGSIAVNQLAPGVMARIMEYLEDPEHKHHIWALELLAQRILPRKLYEELGGQAAGVGALTDRRPMFVLNVLPAAPGGASGAVYDHEGSAQLLPPAPAEAG